MAARFRVYLAGPISGCSSDQATFWRHSIKKNAAWARDFELVDPTDSLLSSDATPHDIVDHDLKAIGAADGLLVNMWKESIGTAIGVVHARAKGKIVVVVDPNRLRNRSLAYYADLVVDTLSEGMHALRDLLRVTTGVIVIKRRGVEEPFSREKLIRSIRASCRAAGLDDIVVPSLVLRGLSKELRSRMKTRTINQRFATSDIERALFDALSLLEADPATTHSVDGLRTAWKDHVAARRRMFRSQPWTTSDSMDSQSRIIRVYSAKSHATIWGTAVKRLEDIPSSDARRALRAVTAVDGVTEVVLREMHGAAPRATCCISLAASGSPNIIEGKLYDAGRKGGLQTFQVRIDRDTEKNHILAGITEQLRNAGAWAER